MKKVSGWWNVGLQMGVLALGVRAEIGLPDTESAAGASGIVVPAPASREESRSTSVPAPVEASVDVLFFLNGDRLTGHLRGIPSFAAGGRWAHASVSKEIEFKLDDVDVIRLAGGDPGPVRPSGDAAVLVALRNGDTVSGRLLGLDAQSLALDTAYAGRLDLQRVEVAVIRPSGESGAVQWDGPPSLTEWKAVRGSDGQVGHWVDTGDGVKAVSRTAALGRLFAGLPVRFSLRLDISRPEGTDFTALLMADRLERLDAGGFDALAAGVDGDGAVTVMHLKADGEMESMDSGASAPVRPGGAVRERVEIFCDRADGAFAFQINGRTVAQGHLPPESKRMGNGLIVGTDDGRGLILHDVRVAHWDGHLPSASPTVPAPASADELRMLNNDRMSGRLDVITNGVVRFESAIGAFDVPLSRVSTLVVAGGTAASVPAPAAQEVRVKLGGDTRLTLRLDSLRDGMLRGHSPFAGDVQLKVPWIRRIECNLHRPRQTMDLPVPSPTDPAMDGVVEELGRAGECDAAGGEDWGAIIVERIEGKIQLKDIEAK